MTKKKGFLNKFKSLIKRNKSQSTDDETFSGDFDETNSGQEEVDLESLPEHLREQLLSEQALETEDELDDDEEIPEFTAMPLNRELIDDEFKNIDETNPSITIPQMESTRETTLPQDIDEEELEARLEAIRDGASHEDDQFDEHSGINDFKEFEINKNNKKSTQIFLNILGRLKGYAPKLTKERIPSLKSSSETSKTLSSIQLFDLLFAPQERPKLHGLFVSIIILCATYGLGKLMALYLDTSTMPNLTSSSSPIIRTDSGSSNNDLFSIARVDLFNANHKTETTQPRPEEPRIDESLICVSSNQVSRLPITLVNTTVLQDSIKSIASVQVRGGRDIRNIREGQKIDSIAEIGKIDRMKVVFKNLSTGQCEFVRTAEANKQATAKPIQVVSEREGQALMNSARNQGIINEGNSYKINKTVRDQMLENISEILTQARAVQIQNPDGTMAFKMTEIVAGSIYSQLNIQDGDIIEGINGSPITNLNEVMSMFGRIREIDTLSLTIRRNGASQNLDYSFD
jgi:type II secretion system protein C